MGLRQPRWRGSDERGRGHRFSVDALCQWCRKAIAPPRHRGDRSRAEQFAQRADLRRDVVFFDYHAGPDQIEQFLFADEPLAALRQGQQQVKCPCAQRRRVTVHPDHALGRADLEAVEAQWWFDGGCWHSRHGNATPQVPVDGVERKVISRAFTAPRAAGQALILFDNA